MDEFAGVQEPPTAEVRYTPVRKLKDATEFQFAGLYGQPDKDLLNMLSTPIELVREPLLPLFLRVRIERALYMDEVVAAHVNADNVQLPFMSSVRPPPHEDGSPNEMAVVLEPFGDELFWMVHTRTIEAMSSALQPRSRWSQLRGRSGNSQHGCNGTCEGPADWTQPSTALKPVEFVHQLRPSALSLSRSAQRVSIFSSIRWSKLSADAVEIAEAESELQ